MESPKQPETSQLYPGIWGLWVLTSLIPRPYVKLQKRA